jgi:drug/metabolite transporter (DMT)-like permease
VPAARRAAVVAVVASAACFATLGILQRWATEHGAEPMSMLAVRFAVAAAIMAGVQAFRDPQSLRVSKGDLARFAAMSISGYGAASLCYAIANRMIGTPVTTVLLYTYPALVSVIGWLFLNERFPPRRIAAVVLTFIGCALAAGVLGSSSALQLIGVLLGLGAGLGYAVFNVLSFRTMARTPRLTLMAYVFAMSAAQMAVAAVASGTVGTVAAWDWVAWGSVALMVAVPTFAAIMLYLGGIQRMGAPQAAVVSTLELPFAVIFAAMAFPLEQLRPVQLLGAAIVLGGVVLAEWGAPAGEVDAAAV